jgi:hypothetical protein
MIDLIEILDGEIPCFRKSLVCRINLRQWYLLSNHNGIVNFATLKNRTVKNTMFPHCNIRKFTWTFSGGKSCIQIDDILTDRRQHSSVLISDHSGQQIVILTTICWFKS